MSASVFIQREVEDARIAASSEQARWDEEIEDKLRVIRELNEVRELNRKCCDENERLNIEVAELKNIINSECNHCGDCAKFGKDCNAGDIDGAEDNRACEKFVSKEVAELREFSNDMRTWFRLFYSCGSDPKSKWWRSCASCRRKSCPIHKWRKALKGSKDDSTSC